MARRSGLRSAKMRWIICHGAGAPWQMWDL
jgi:hypothetical protein